MWLVLRKELKELLRDRRTLFFMVLFPLFIFPLLFGGVTFFAKKAVQEAESKVLSFSIINPEFHTEMSDAFKSDEQFKFIDLKSQDFHEQDFHELVQQGRLDFVMEFAENLNQNPILTGQSEIKLYLNDSAINMIFNRVNNKVKLFSKQKQLAIFEQLGVPETAHKGVLQPIWITKVNLADKREDIGEKIGGFFPYVLFLILLQGVMYLAADLGAGEKERGTLETLLLAPVPRYEIVLGKFMALVVAGVTSAIMTLGSMVGWGIAIGQGLAISVISQFVGQIGVIDFVLMFLMLLPIVAIFASLTLCLSIYAKSYKEAQTYMGYLMILILVPIIFSMLPGVTLQGGWAWVPLTNVALAIKELIKGTMDYSALVAIFVSTAAIGAGLIMFSVYWFKQEKVLFR